jgi:transposase InsO family protein
MYAVEKMCNVLGVSRGGYYDWLNRKPSRRSLKNQEIVSEIKIIHKKSKQRYGSPKITQELIDKGYQVSQPRVARLMKKQGIKSMIRKKYRVATTDSNHQHSISENHLNREFTRQKPSEAWVSDITYIPTNQGWLYLTIIMDLFDRKIIGWSLSNNMTTEDTVMKAWKMAVKNRQVTKNMIFHSDRGVQYASESFRNTIKSYKVMQSMSRKGNCWDNAVAENFFKILKEELIYHCTYNNHFQAKVDIFQFIEIWYNRHRKHAFLGYKTPVEFFKFNYKIAA